MFMFIAKMPGCLEDDNIRLRPLRIFDGPFITDGLRNKDILKSNGLSKPMSSLWFSFWWWIKKTFMPCYCIECDSKRIGFIGLYNLSPGKSAEMSLAIFNETLRRHGYGTRAFRLLVQGLKRYSVVKNLLVKVETGNHAAISFWRKLGFIETASSIMKCNTWESRKGDAILSVYGKTIQTSYYDRTRTDSQNEV